MRTRSKKYDSQENGARYGGTQKPFGHATAMDTSTYKKLNESKFNTIQTVENF
jgi:hypothetical protein